MTSIDLRPPCPLTVQFWLLGLDARQGHLLLRGFRKRPASQGSSTYVLDHLSLHSSGLSLGQESYGLRLNRLQKRWKSERTREGEKRIPGVELANRSCPGLLTKQTESVSDLLWFNRRTRSYTLNGRPIPAGFARQLLRPALQAHEEWIMRRFGPGYRQAQFSAQRPPRVVFRSLESWRQYIRPAAFGLAML